MSSIVHCYPDIHSPIEQHHTLPCSSLTSVRSSKRHECPTAPAANLPILCLSLQEIRADEDNWECHWRYISFLIWEKNLTVFHVNVFLLMHSYMSTGNFQISVQNKKCLIQVYYFYFFFILLIYLLIYRIVIKRSTAINRSCSCTS